MELVKVHGSGAVLVHLLDDVVQVVLCQGGVNLPEDLLKHLVGDEALALLVVDPERVLQLSLHRLHVGVLDQEGGAELAELADLNLAGAVLVDLLEDVAELLLRGPEAKMFS